MGLPVFVNHCCLLRIALAVLLIQFAACSSLKVRFSTKDIPDILLTSFEQPIYFSSILDDQPTPAVLTANAAIQQTTYSDLLYISQRTQDYFVPYLQGVPHGLSRAFELNSVLRSAGMLHIHYAPEASLSAEEVFLQRQANCISFSNLFIAVARGWGMDARYQLVSSQRNWERYRLGVMLALHVNVLLRFKNGGEMTIDFSPKPSATKAGLTTTRNQTELRKIISDDTAHALFWNNLAIDKLATRHVADAYRYLVKAISLDPQLSQLWTNLGIVFRHNNQTGSAEKSYKIALQLNPEESVALNNLVAMYQRAGNTEKAHYYFMELEKMNQRNPYYIYYLAEKAENDNDYSRAIKLLRRAIRMKQDDPMFHNRLNHLLASHQ